MKKENNYDFLKRMAVIHKPDRRDRNAVPQADEVAIDDSWEIAIPADACSKIRRSAEDFQDYLLVSMGVGVKIERVEKLEPKAKRILFKIGTDKTSKKGGFALDVADGVVLAGAEVRGVIYGAIRLEDLMNYREAPFLKKGSFVREPLARMRSIHSGCAIDDFPDWQLNAILHAGFTAIDVFIKGIDTTVQGHTNINDIIDRADEFGLDTVLYNYIHCYKHPDDPDAEEFFDSVYGPIGRHYPKAAAIHLVGESLEFPSHDPHTTGKRWHDSVIDGIPDTRPSPGWYTCYDYPAYIARIRKALDKVNPNIELIFNTYNSGWNPEEDRKKFIEAMPKNVTIHVTYDIFKMIEHDGLKCPVMDYSGVAETPGFYFESEAKVAAACGHRLRATTNTGGMTWDFGTVPYEPIPQRWLKRMLNLKYYLQNYGLDSFYETHHYGWWPNPANDLEKEVFFSDGSEDYDAVLHKIAKRDYGADVADDIVKVWQTWSDAMGFYIASNEDQYGPWRVGPAYPLIFHPNISRTMARKEIDFPAAPYAHFGGGIVKTFYQPYENENQTPGPLRYPVDLKYLAEMLELWEKGMAILDAALPKMKGAKRENGERLALLGKFIRNSTITTSNVKKWWLVNTKMVSLSTKEEMLKCMDELQKIADAERANTIDTIPVVEQDSRIGWEPSMEYVCDAWHLNWKLRQLDAMQREMDTYRKMIML